MKDNMEQHLIVLDLDGTLLQGFSTYDEETFSYLRKLKDEGHLIVIATGRPFRSSYFIYQELGLNTPIINYNGARITNPTDKNFPTIDLRIDRDDLLTIIENVRPYLINVFCEIIDNIYVQDYNEDIHPFLHVDNGILHCGELKDILPGNPNGALFFLDSEHVKDFEHYIFEEYTGKLYSRYWGMGKFHIVEIYNQLVDKAMGVKKIMDYYQIPKERTIAIGDGHNDIGIINTAGIGVAMGNSHPDLTKVAKYHTDTCENQGVLKFLKSYFEKK